MCASNCDSTYGARNGLVAWVGAEWYSPLFGHEMALNYSPTMASATVGNSKNDVNVRLDLGFGRHQTGFIFSINEAF